MIRYLIVLYLGLVSIVLVDPNPLWASPLLIVLGGLIWDRRWLVISGILAFSLISIGHIGDASFSELPRLVLLTVSLVMPLVILLEASLAGRPYRLQRISLGPVLVASGILAGFFFILWFLVRMQRIGVYLSTDGLLQVFITMALSIFLTGPILLGSRPARKDGTDRSPDVRPSTIKTNK